VIFFTFRDSKYVNLKKLQEGEKLDKASTPLTDSAATVPKPTPAPFAKVGSTIFFLKSSLSLLQAYFLG